jgi:hypothetical protein
MSLQDAIPTFHDPTMMKLSVLIPTITERESEANALYRSLELRVAGRDVEILMMRENLLCGIGEARNKLLRAAGGEVYHLSR